MKSISICKFFSIFPVHTEKYTKKVFRNRAVFNDLLYLLDPYCNLDDRTPKTTLDFSVENMRTYQLSCYQHDHDSDDKGYVCMHKNGPMAL